MRVWPLIASLAGVALLGTAFWLWTPDLKREALEARWATPPSTFVTVSGIRLHLRDTGPKDAPVVLLLHGFGSSLHSWEPWAQALSVDHRVLRLDLPGAGLSEPDPAGDYHDEHTIALLLALLDQFGVPRVSLIGHSMGGRLAWRLAAEVPQRVDKLVLVAPDGYASAGFEYGKAPEVPVALKLMRWITPRPLLAMSLAPAFADPAQLTDERITRYHELMRAPGVRDAMLARLQQSVLQDPRPILARIRAPTLLIWGETDAMIPVANAADYMRALPTSRLELVSGAGHLLQEEAPEKALPALRAFLAR